MKNLRTDRIIGLVVLVSIIIIVGLIYMPVITLVVIATVIAMIVAGPALVALFGALI